MWVFSTTQRQWLVAAGMCERRVWGQGLWKGWEALTAAGGPGRPFPLSQPPRESGQRL